LEDLINKDGALISFAYSMIKRWFAVCLLCKPL